MTTALRDVAIREHRPGDAADLRSCVVVLQDAERGTDPRLRSGEEMADAYLEQLLQRTAANTGRIYVAEADGAVAGFVAVQAREPFTELDEPPGTHGLVSDLVVRPAYRRRGIGAALLARAIAFARAEGVRDLRIGVLARNAPARQLYLNAGFQPHAEILTMRWPT